MKTDFRTQMKEIIDIVNMCPEKFQDKCFEILLNDLLMNNSKSESIENAHLPLEQEKKIVEVKNTIESKTAEQEIEEKDLHMILRKFFNSNYISIDDINKLYYKEDGIILPLYEVSCGNTLAAQEVNLAILMALDNCLKNENSDFIVHVEELREKCKSFKCYDAKNFKSHLKNHTEYFDGLETDTLKLTPEGKKQLACTIKELIEKV